jgi:O-antigen/teichoic acid export membrane protein
MRQHDQDGNFLRVPPTYSVPRLTYYEQHCTGPIASAEVPASSDQGEAEPRIAPALGNLASLTISFAGSSVLTILIARFLGPHTYGTYALLTWIIFSVNAIAGAGFRMTMTKHVAQYFGAKAGDIAAAIVRTVLFWQGTLGLALAGALALCVPWLPNLTLFSGTSASASLSLLELLLTAVALPCVLLAGTAIAALQGLQRYDLVALITAFALPIEVLCSLVVLELGWSISGLLAVLGGVNVLTFFAALLFTNTWLPLVSASRLPAAIGRTLRHYGGSIVIIALFDMIVWQRSEVFFLAYYRPAAEAGFYNLAYTLASTVMNLLPGALAGVLVPAITRLLADTPAHADRQPVRSGYHGQPVHTTNAPPETWTRASELFLRGARHLSLLAFPLAGVGIAFAPDLLQLVIGAHYLPVASPLRVLLVSSAIAAISGACSAVLYSTNRQRIILMIGAPVAALNLTLDILFIPRFGLMGAAWSNLAAQVCAALTAFMIASRLLQVMFPWQDILRVIGGTLLGIMPLWYIYQAIFLPRFPVPVALFIALLAIGPCCIAALWLARALTVEDILLLVATLRRVVRPR